MILVHRLGKEEGLIAINADMIEYIESNPDTLVVLSNGKKIVVKEDMEKIIELIIEYKRSIK
jgi:flagellar protein FlbD